MPTHEEIVAAWQGLNSDPRFSALSYEEQQKIRAQWAERNLPQDPQFTALNRAGQTMLFQRMVTQPPSFAQPSDFTNESMQIAQAAQAGDPQALKDAAFQVAGVRAGMNAGSIYQLVVNVAEKVTGMEDMADINLTDDDRKAVDYLQQVVMTSDNRKWWQAALINTAPFVGIAANIASGRVAMQAPLAATRATGVRGLLFDRSGQLAANTQRITGSMATSLAAGRGTRFATWAMRSALPEVIESGLDATMLAAGDLFSRQLQRNAPFGVQANKEFGQFALNFGLDFLGDMVFFGAANLIGTAAKAGLKVIRPRGFAGKAVEAVSDVDFDDLATRFVSGQDVPKAVWNSLPRPTQQTFLRLRRTFAAAKNLDEASPNDLARMVGLSHGYDMVSDAGKIQLKPVIGKLDDVPGAWANEQNALQALFKAQSEAPSTTARMMDAALQNEAGIEAVSAFKFGDDIPNLDTLTVTRAFVPDANGQMNPRTVQVATRSLLQRAGVDPDELSKVVVKPVPADQYWQLSDVARQKSKHLLMPDNIRTADQMRSFTQQFGDDLTSHLGTTKLKGRAARYVNDVTEGLETMPVASNPVFIEADAVRHGIDFQVLPNGMYRVGSETVGSLAEAGDSVHRQILFSSEDSVRSAFRQYGFEFDQTEEGRWIARGRESKKGGDIFTGSHETIQGAADELYSKGFRPRLSQEKAANVIINAEGDGVEILHGGATIRGPLEYIRDYANKFRPDVSDAQILKKYRGGDVIAKGKIDHVFRVTSPEWGVVKGFTSYKEAVEFVEKARNGVEDLLEIGLLKGVPDIRITGGRIVARRIGDTQPHDFRTVRELKSWLKNLEPSPEWAKEISNMDQGMIDTVWEQIDPEMRELYLSKTGVPVETNFNQMLDHMKDNATWKVGGSAPTGEYGRVAAYRGAATGIAQFIKDALYTPTYARVRRIVGQTGRDVLGRGFESMEKSIKNARALTAQASELLDGITRFDGAPKRKRRVLLRPFLEVDESEWIAKSKLWELELDDNDIRYLRRFRTASDALGRSFGVDAYRMINYHLPRIQKFMADNPDLVANAQNAREILSKMDARLPRELEFFSEYLRVEELSNFINTADPQDILTSYATKGIKNMTLGKTYERLIDEWNTLIKNKGVSAEESYTMFRYLEATMGMYSDEASKAAEHSARETGRILAQRMGAKQYTGAFKDYINKLHGFTIAATMSFRPWPVIRNLQQVWTTLAPMFGNDSVMRALKVMADDDAAGEVYQRLLKTGRLQDRIPIHGGVYEATGTMGLVNKAGMKLYKSSDDYTRMVVDIVVRDTFTDAVAKLNAGIVNEKKFIRLANLHRLDDFDQREIVRRLRGYTDESGRAVSGSFDAAMDYYGDVVTRETMFAYTAGANPMMFNGMWGRLFGMFGHYPVYYAQTLVNGLRRGNLADKALFAGRVAFNTAALWFAFDQVMGVKSDNFKPWKTMFFDGGPYFKLLTNTLEAAAGSPGSSWDMVKQDTRRLFIPGSLMGESVLQGVKLMEQGQSYQGFLRLMSAPLADD
jgi:hypothetical protein